MNSFKDYYNDIEEDQLDEEMLNEEAVTIVMAILGIPSVIALIAWAGSVIFTSYIKGLGKVTGKVIQMWRNLFRDLRGYVTKDSVKETIDKVGKDPKARDQARKTERNKRAFNEELKNVYEAIENKDFNTAKDEFEKTPKFIQNNPDVYKVIIAEISRVLKEPPLYIKSPGNETYQAIKKVINIRVAKAAAYATKITLERSLKSGSVEKENEPKEEPTKNYDDEDDEDDEEL